MTWHDWTDDEKEMLGLRAQQLRRNRPDISQPDLFLKVQVFLPPERRCSRFDYEEHAWLNIASHRGTMSQIAAKVDAIHEQLARLLDILKPASRSNYIPLDPPSGPDGGTRYIPGRLGISLEDTEQVEALVDEIRADDQM